MYQNHSKRSTHALIVSYIALFIALISLGIILLKH